jgi:hypothetical protein
MHLISFRQSESDAFPSPALQKRVVKLDIKRSDLSNHLHGGRQHRRLPPRPASCGSELLMVISFSFKVRCWIDTGRWYVYNNLAQVHLVHQSLHALIAWSNLNLHSSKEEHRDPHIVYFNSK